MDHLQTPRNLSAYTNRRALLKNGKMADVVLWNQDPFSVYAKPLQVYIDGVLRYEHRQPLTEPSI